MRIPTALLLAAFALLGLHCGTTSEADREWSFSTPDSAADTQTPTFESRADTVAAKHSTEHTVSASRKTGVRYAVQIGSFRLRRNAAQALALTRQRVQLPVINEYDPVKKLHQVRIGFFSTWEEALTFRTRLIAAYPHEYDDAWIVRITTK